MIPSIHDERLRIVAISGRPIDSLGGAERSLARLCKALSAHHDLQLLAPTTDGATITNDGREDFYLYNDVMKKLESVGAVDIIYLGSHFMLKTPTAFSRMKTLFPTAKLVLKETTAGKLIRVLARLEKQEASQILRDLDAIVCTSYRIWHDYQYLSGFNGQLELIPNGVDTRLFAPVTEETQTRIRRRLGLDTSRPLVIFSGRFAEKKNLDVIYGAWLDMERHFGDWAQLVLVGKIHKHYDAGIVRLMREDLRNVKFIGPFSRDEDLASCYQAADFFLAPTSREGLSNAFLEASACGLYPVVTAISGYEDVITTPKSGMLVEERNTSDVIRCLKMLNLNPDTYRRYARDCLRPHIVSNHDIHHVAQLYHNLFTRLREVR